MFEIFRRLRAPLLAVIAVLVCAAPASAVELPAVSIPANSFGGPAISPISHKAQSFTAAYGGTIQKLTVWAHREDETPAGSDLRVELRAATLSGTPGDVIATGIAPRDSVPVFNRGANPVTVPLPGGVVLERGGRYFLALSATNAPVTRPTHFYVWEMTFDTELQNIGELSFGRDTATGPWTGGPCHCYALGMDVRVDATDAQPPAVSFTTPTDGQRFEFGATPTADYACTDDLKLVSCTGSTADGAALARSVGEHSLSVTAADVAGKSTTATRAYTVADTVAPTVTSSQEGAEFEVGTSVPTSFRCDDLAAVLTCAADRDTLDTSAVGPKAYVVTAADAHGQTTRHAVSHRVIDTVDPAVDSSQDGETFELGAEVPASADCTDAAGLASCEADRPVLDTATLGTHTFTVSGTDKSGRTATRTITYTVADTTAPSIIAPQDGATAEFGTEVRADFTCVDLAKVQACEGPAALDTGSLGTKTYTVLARDTTGLERSKTVSYTVEDTTRPTVAAPQDGATFEFGETVGARFTCADRAEPVECVGPAAVATGGVGPHSYEVTATDAHGLTSTKTVEYTVADTTRPTIDAPQDGATFEFGDTVEARFTCADRAGPVECVGPAAVATGGVGPHSYEVTATDAHGLTSTKTVEYTVADTTRPTIDAPQDGATFELGAPAATSFSCDDRAKPVGCVATADRTEDTVGTHTYQVTATDAHGLTSTKTIGYTVTDTTAPSIGVSAPAEGSVHLLGADVPTRFACKDLAATSCDAPAKLDTKTVGTKTFTVIAVDEHDNRSTRTVSYRVVYDFAGWYSPVSAWPAVNVVRAGSTVPVKFSLAGDQGLAVLAAGSPTSTSLSCDSLGNEVDVAGETVTTSTGLTYDAASGRYQLNWKTKPEWAGQCRQLVVELADGTRQRAAFRLR